MNEESGPLYEKLIYQNDVKFYQLKLVVNEFRGEQYIHLRKYFQSYEGDYVPSREGISMVASIPNIFALLEGLIELCSKEESADVIDKYFSDKISSLRSESQ